MSYSHHTRRARHLEALVVRVVADRDDRVASHAAISHRLPTEGCLALYAAQHEHRERRPDEEEDVSRRKKLARLGGVLARLARHRRRRRTHAARRLAGLDGGAVVGAFGVAPRELLRDPRARLGLGSGFKINLCDGESPCAARRTNVPLAVH